MRLFFSFILFALSFHVLSAKPLSEIDLRAVSVANADTVSPLVERIAQQYLCNVDLMQSAETRIDNKRIETVAVLRFDGAEQIGFYFSTFKLPPGAYLILRNIQTSDETRYDAALSGDLATDILAGSRFELVVSQPVGSSRIQLVLSSFGVSTVPMYLSTSVSSLKSSGTCNVDIVCPQGAPWRQVGGAVCRLIINNSINCTGTLVNNTADDGKLYILTANHCISNAATARNTLFVFDYEKDACGGKPLKGVSVSGAWLRATSPDKSVDFALLELFAKIPPSATIYYAGWDASGATMTTPVVAVHHPSGDVKKVSRSASAPSTQTFEPMQRGYKFVPNSHWNIAEWVVGVTEFGSSGCAIFNTSQQIVGTLSGGDAKCGSPYNDYFQKLSYSWDYFTDSSQQLKYWLDPLNSGTTVHGGIGQADYCAGGTNDLYILSNMQSTGYLFGTVPDEDTEFGRYFNKCWSNLSAVSVYVGHNTLTLEDIISVRIYGADSGSLELIQEFPLRGSDLLAYSENRIALPQSVSLPNNFFVSLYVPQTVHGEFSLYTNYTKRADVMSMVKQYDMWMTAADLAVGYELPMCIYTSNEPYDKHLKMASVEANVYTGIRPEFAYPYDSVLIYPNPTADGTVEILMQGVLDKQVRISAYTSNGTLVGTMVRDLATAGNAMTCDFGYLPAGIYTLHFELESGSIFRKLMIER